MAKVQTSELTGAALDWAVAKCKGVRTIIARYEHTMTGVCILDAELVEMQTDGPQELRYSREWSQGGPIKEKHEICSGYKHQPDTDYVPQIDLATRCWARTTAGGHLKHGPTELIAAMRCFCCSKLGDVVDIPEELCQQQSS